MPDTQDRGDSAGPSPHLSPSSAQVTGDFTQWRSPTSEAFRPSRSPSPLIHPGGLADQCRGSPCDLSQAMQRMDLKPVATEGLDSLTKAFNQLEAGYSGIRRAPSRHPHQPKNGLRGPPGGTSYSSIHKGRGRRTQGHFPPLHSSNFARTPPEWTEHMNISRRRCTSGEQSPRPEEAYTPIAWRPQSWGSNTEHTAGEAHNEEKVSVTALLPLLSLKFS